MAFDLRAPAGFTARAATHDDADAVYALIVACDEHDLGEADYSPADLRQDWRGRPLDEATRVLVNDGGAMGAYALLHDRHPVRGSAEVFVHPDGRGRGLGTWLTRWAEDHARAAVDRAPDGARVTMEFASSADNHAALALLANEGYAPVRYFLRMRIDFDGPIGAPSWPPGVTVRTFVPGRDEQATHSAIMESFSDHWGHLPEPYEHWVERSVRQQNFDPSLWFLAEAADELAGISLCSVYPDRGVGWVNTVGVRRPWRRSGVGLALMRHSLGALQSRGMKRADLGVDADSLTGATRLYEKAGMHEAMRFAICRKEIRPGTELALNV